MATVVVMVVIGCLVAWLLVVVDGKDCMYARVCVYMCACVRARGDGGGESTCHVIRNNNRSCDCSSTQQHAAGA
jgi:hypothetical protein